jgi:hypothetical protein
MTKPIKTCWVFASSSSNARYQALLYLDGSTSCDCPGWTRRCSPSGQRTCKHTRAIDCGIADSESVSHTHYYGKAQNAAIAPAPAPPTKKQPAFDVDQLRTGRLFDL